MLPENLKHLEGKQIPVLDQGYVQLIDVMGDDQRVEEAARISYGEGTRPVSKTTKLLRFMMRHRHATPFEHASATFQVMVPMDCWRQWIRHRTAKVNEYSTRYSVAIDAAQRTAPDAWRLQDAANRQGGDGFVTEWPEGLGRPFIRTAGAYLTAREVELQKFAREVYEERLAFGVERGQARKDLPLSTYTKAYWTIDLRNLLHFLGLRMDSHAQWEIRQYAQAIGDITRQWAPISYQAFEDYQFLSLRFSPVEWEGLQAVFDRATSMGGNPWGEVLDRSGLKGRERDEFAKKLDIAA